jgi:hypothetical protein
MNPFQTCKLGARLGIAPACDLGAQRVAKSRPIDLIVKALGTAIAYCCISFSHQAKEDLL